MNFVENNGKKVAAILCVASAFPVVATVIAAKEEPGWHGDHYVNEDKTVAKGWQEIEGKTYYFAEDGSVDTTKTEKAVTASVSSSITGDVQETVATAGQQAVQEETEAKEAQAKAEAETAAAEEKATVDSTDTTEQPAEDTNEPTTEAPVTSGDVVDQTPAVDQTPTVDDTTQAPSQDDNYVAPDQSQTDNSYQEPTQTPDSNTGYDDTNNDYNQPTEDDSQNTVVPSAPEQTPSQDTVASDLGTRIAEAAKQLVGVTDGQWCTQVVQQALANAGVSDAYQLWPDQYIMYGYYTNDPQVGDLIYYNNGGRGVDHIAIYIGNGLAVHGNYWEDGKSQTLIRSVNISGGAPQYIRVVR